MVWFAAWEGADALNGVLLMLKELRVELWCFGTIELFN